MNIESEPGKKLKLFGVVSTIRFSGFVETVEKLRKDEKLGIKLCFDRLSVVTP